MEAQKGQLRSVHKGTWGSGEQRKKDMRREVGIIVFLRLDSPRSGDGSIVECLSGALEWEPSAQAFTWVHGDSEALCSRR